MSRTLPEVVNYTVGDRTQKALVLSAREGEASHLGADGEPLLTLAIVKPTATNAPHKRPSLLQADLATPEIEIVRDVVHASHEFSADFKEQKGILTDAHVATHRGIGEYTFEDEGAIAIAEPATPAPSAPVAVPEAPAAAEQASADDLAAATE